jgi:RNA polymerase sigma-70 factor (ECF subfamily)
MEAMELERNQAGEARSDEASDFDARFATARGRLLGICSPLVGANEAEDVVHDTYLAGRARYSGLRDPNAFDAWLIRIAINRCMDRHRRGSRVFPLKPTYEGGSASSRDLGLRELVERLPPRERTILVLHYGHGYGLQEIGQLLDLSHTNVRTIIARARQGLLRAMREAEA